MVLTNETLVGIQTAKGGCMPRRADRTRIPAWLGSLALALGAVWLCAATASAGFNHFESGHVRPLALSPDGTRLFAVNTPDNRLDIFDVNVSGLTRVASVMVGLEPVAVAARNDSEVWVVNHLSDSVSIVAVDAADPSLSRVVRTLLVGDEPRDIVFAGTGGNRAFITTARRGQHLPGSVPANLITPGTPRALVWAFDANDLGAALGGTPLSVIPLFADTPRALAVSNTGATVYAAAFHSGNRTTGLTEPVVSAGGGVPPFPPGSTPGAPNTGLIVRFNGTQWVDEIDRDWTASVNFSLPDRDVFLINANANPPAASAAPNVVSGVGTILFNIAVKPSNGLLYVSNLEARNAERFESLFESPSGSGTFRGVRGHTAENRITVIDTSGGTPHHLNPHVNYNVPTGPQSEIDQSIAFPLGMVFSPDSSQLFVAAFGSGDVAVLDTADLEDADASITNAPVRNVGGGPSGLALDVANDRLYVMNRIDQQIAIIQNATNPGTRSLWKKVDLSYDAEPPAVRDGRRFLYDASRVSGHGDSSCATCHIFGDLDSLAWDLGDPFGEVLTNPNPFVTGVSGNDFHPLKGPMTTQSLRGMAGQGPMHWRGDRTGGNDPGGSALDEDAGFKKFNPAFVNLLGRASELPAADMQKFTDFVLALEYPPNPVRPLDNVGTAQQVGGEDFMNTQPSDGQGACVVCHVMPTGAGGVSSFEGETQEFKIPHLRNAYAKVGMFLAAGNQVRGFGFAHDGAVPTVFLFLSAPAFNFNAGPGGTTANQRRRSVENFIHALDTGLRPIVGQQVSATPTTFADATVVSQIGLLIARADAGDCELVVKGVAAGEARGALYVGGNQFQPDRASDALVPENGLRNLAAAAGQELTYTCVPPGAGARIALDRDEDGFFDRDELDADFDPADPQSPTDCEDGLDNDGDALADLGDPGCRDAASNLESPGCNDGIDNDLDSLTDLADPQCGNAWSDNELASPGACGLLGLEALPLLAWAAARRSRALPRSRAA
jgi:DNA-binding beta-propeller fold protein YncE